VVLSSNTSSNIGVKYLEENNYSPVKENKDKNNTYLTMDINTAHDRLAHTSESILRETMKEYGIKLIGKLNACDECLQVKAKAKGVPKTTKTLATQPGERLYVDTSGPCNKQF
jgi:hypothetical protein